jgi:hypothetical protein
VVTPPPVVAVVVIVVIVPVPASVAAASVAATDFLELGSAQRLQPILGRGQLLRLPYPHRHLLPSPFVITKGHEENTLCFVLGQPSN